MTRPPDVPLPRHPPPEQPALGSPALADAQPRIVRTRILATHPRITVMEHDVAVDGDETRTRPIVTLALADWAVVLARTVEGDFVLVEQFRFGIRAHTVEIAGGVVDPGESPEEAARRELAEETGYAAGALVSLGSVVPNPALYDNRAYLYFADGVTKVAHPAHDPEEVVAPRLLDRPALERAVASGTIDHGLTLLVIARALARLDAVPGTT